MISQLIQPEIKDLIQSRSFSTLKELLIDWQPADIADVIEALDESERAVLFRLLPKELAADTFEYMDFDLQMDIIKALGHEEVAEILNEMSPDDRTDMLEELPAPIARQMIMMLSPEERKIAQNLLGYPENSVGRLMTPDYVAVSADWTVNQTLDYIREYGHDSETLNIIYVTDEKGRLIDDIKIREFLLSKLETQVKDLMDENYLSLNVHDDQEQAVDLFKKYDRVALPVTDSSGVLIGIVTIDDVFDVAEEETSEDIYKTAAVEVLDDTYKDTPLMQMIRKRAGWLSVLFVGEMLTTTVMAFFEVEIAKAVILAVFIPLIISSGGNSGSQASTLVIRALALGELSIKDWFFVIKRELMSGLILGAILALLGFSRILAWQLITGIYGIHWVYIGLTVGFALIGVVTWGTIMGSVFPLILKKLGFDPAVSSAPFVATMVDVFGIIIYFLFAIMLLSGKLL